MNVPIRAVQDDIKKLLDKFEESIFGLTDVARLCLLALFTGGHILLEGHPGVGKTALVNRLSQLLGLQFGRIQFTPDLMPSDITGTDMPKNPGPGLEFKKGPILECNLLLADEINRATPKTQSATLEAMAENQVTVLGKTHKVKPPFFFVVATQNPLEHEGTYPLPEAQLDRFMFKLLIPAPNADTLQQILDATCGAKRTVPKNSDHGSPGARSEAVLDTHFMERIPERIRSLEATDELTDLIKNLISGRSTGTVDWSNIIRFFPGPRAAIALLLGAKAWCLLFQDVDRGGAGPSALGPILVPVLRHRLHLHFEWRRRAQEQKLNIPGEDKLSDATARDLLILRLCERVARDATGGNDAIWHCVLSGLPPRLQELAKL